MGCSCSRQKAPPRLALEYESLRGMRLYVRGDDGFDNMAYQYATTSKVAEMTPAVIIVPEPESIADVIRVVQFAKDNDVAIAVRTGGHCYIGASSTSGRNIQLDLEHTFRTKQLLSAAELVQLDAFGAGCNRDLVYLRVGVSVSLGEFNKWLYDNRLFVPHGLCKGVFLGGHVQTGGYGNFIRSFGLFCDYIYELTVVTANGEDGADSGPIVRTVHRGDDLFYALLGGSPGNFGVLTGMVVGVLQDDHYVAHGLKMAISYDPARLESLLAIVAENSTRSRGFDLNVSVLSAYQDVVSFFPSSDAAFRKRLGASAYGQDEMLIWPASIVVFAQWVSQGPEDTFDSSGARAWFSSLTDMRHGESVLFTFINDYAGYFMPALRMVKPDIPTPPSRLSAIWLFTNIREYPMPYVKRNYITTLSGAELQRRGWPAWCAERINRIQNPVAYRSASSIAPAVQQGAKYCCIVSQAQSLGGVASQYWSHPDRGFSSHSWRNDGGASLQMSFDCFFSDHPTHQFARSFAVGWQAVNDIEIRQFQASNAVDRRLFWGAFYRAGGADSWRNFYEPNIYARILSLKRLYDPAGIFTANSHSIDQMHDCEAPGSASVSDLVDVSEAMADTASLGKVASELSASLLPLSTF